MESLGSLDNLIKTIAKLPNLGPRSAKRIVLSMLKNPDKLMLPLAEQLIRVAGEIKTCDTCGNIDVKSPCGICESSGRDKSMICVVEDISDLWAVEKGAFYKGTYHVLGGALSALDGITPDKLNFEGLRARVANSNISEVIIATSSTINGQTTGFYISDMIKEFNIKTSRLASGIPVGAELDYMDEGTLALALKTRQTF